MKPITLLTPHTVLRSSQDGDAEKLFLNYCSNVYSSQFLTRLPHHRVEQTADFLNNWCKVAWSRELDQFAWVIALRNTNEAIGIFIVELDRHKAQIHYGIGYDFCNQGFVTEAGKAVIQWLMEQPNLQRVWAVCDLINFSSIRVLEKLGLQKEGLLRKWLSFPAFGGLARDCYIYARTWDPESLI
jgi:[ribosomal protein S5]-alanine N-acetyltransferase